MGVSELWSRGFALFPEAGAGEEEDATDGAATRGASHGTDGGERGGRPRWGSTAEFVLAAIGSAVGLGNLLRFPYMVYKHGGCAFLVPYALAVVFLGVPILAMELALGQVAQSGCVDALAAMHARAWGIGAAATAGAFLLASYYCAVLAWAWCFLAATWQPTMPWSDGRAAAFFVDDVLARWDSRDGTDSSHVRANGGANGPDGADGADGAVAAFARLGLGPMNWWLVLGLTLTWAMCFLCVKRGAESAGKAVWITVPLPYAALLVLFVKGVFHTEGAGVGVRAYLGTIDANTLGKGEAWIDAIGQIFFGLSVCCGAMPAYASNCSLRERCGTNAIRVAVANSVTSLLSGFVVFAFLGHLARVESVGVGDVAEGGWSLAFVVYPTAFATFGSPGGQIFATSFWLAILTLGVDSAFALTEAVVCAVCDRSRYCAEHRGFAAFCVCFLCWCLGLVMCTRGGYHVVDIVDAYVSRYTLTIAGLAECVFVGWVYGAERLRDETRATSGHDFMGVGSYFPVTIKYVVPAALVTMLSYQIATEARETYGGYPRWATNAFGWGLCVVAPLSLACVGLARPLDVGRKFCEGVGGAPGVFDGSRPYSTHMGVRLSDEGVGRPTRVTDGVRTLDRGEVEMGPSGI